MSPFQTETGRTAVKSVRREATLIEMIVAMAVGVSLLGLGTQMFVDALDRCRDSVRAAERQQEITILKTQWRRFVHSLPDAVLALTEDGRLVTVQATAEVQGQQIVLTYPDGRRKPLRIPEGMTAELTAEQTRRQGDTAVLRLSWCARRSASGAEEFVRLVACNPGTAM